MKIFGTVLLFGACLTACSSVPRTVTTGGESSQLFAVAVDSAPFFRYGPQQDNGADKMLPRDTIVTVIKPSFGYSRVELKDGQVGFVPTMDLRRASAELIAAASSAQKPARSRTTLDPADPRLQAPAEPLPEIFPEPTPIPDSH